MREWRQGWPGLARLRRFVVRESDLLSEIEDETAFHLAEKTEELIAGGLPPEEARREAERRFGDRGRVHASVGRIDRRRLRRAERRHSWVGLWQNLRYSVRTLARHRAFTVTATLCLAIGIGAVTLVFSLLNGLLLQPLEGIDRVDELLYVDQEPGGSYPNYLDVAASGLFGESTAYTDGIMALAPSEGDVGETTLGITCTGTYFEVLGTKPALGRLLEPSDDRPGAPPVVVLSHAYWQSRLGGREDTIGRVVRVNGRPFTVVGITEPGFLGTFLAFQVDVWVPWSWIGTSEPLSDPTRRDDHFLEVAARLPPHTTVESAQAAADTIAAGLERDHPDANRGYAIELLPTTGVDPEIRVVVNGLLGVLLVAAALLLVLACVPVVNMLLSHGTLRARELAVRVALGADRSQIVRLVLIESLLLGLAGGVGGLLLASWLSGVFDLLEPRIPVQLALDFSPDIRVFSFVALVSVLTGVLFGLVPALRLARADLNGVLKSEGLVLPWTRLPVRKLLVGAQVAIAALLLVVGGLFLRTVRQTHGLDAGFDPAGRAVVPRVDLTLVDKTPEEAVELYRRIAQRAAALPGVERASVGTQVPLNPMLRRTARIEVAGAENIEHSRREGGHEVDFASVLPGYLDTLGIAILQGRDIGPEDRADTRSVAVVNRTFAERFFAGDALGRSFDVLRDTADGRQLRESLVVVGVAESGRYRNLADVGSPYFWAPLTQVPAQRAHLVVQTKAPLDSLSRALGREVVALEPGLPIEPMVEISEFLELALLPQKVTASLAGAMGVVALLLAAVGIYGVVAYSVEQRRRELGIRLSLGARSTDLIAMIVAEGSRLTLAGLALGLVLALLVARVVRGMLHGVGPSDPLTYVGIAATLAVTAFLASLLPALRASRVDASRSLRDE